jgi:mRNA-degrading endonuclease RelE of RelBE toxin-antitoxin system
MTAFRTLRESEPEGAAFVATAVAALAAEPRPVTSTALGDTAFRRLRIDRYRVLYELTSDAVRIMHVGQVFPY